jgi:hypothetical protein
MFTTEQNRSNSFTADPNNSMDNMARDDADNNKSCQVVPKYATGIRLIMVMLTINLTTLIASLDLVSQPDASPFPTLILLTGHRCHSHSRYHGFFPCPQRHWLVRGCLLHSRRCLIGHVGEAIYLFARAVGVRGWNPDIHGGKCDSGRGTEQRSLDPWTRRAGLRVFW